MYLCVCLYLNIYLAPFKNLTKSIHKVTATVLFMCAHKKYLSGNSDISMMFCIDYAKMKSSPFRMPREAAVVM